MTRASRYSGWALWTVLALSALLSGCGRKVELMAAMPEAEANEVLAALQNAHIEADKVPGKEGNVGINIDGAQVGRAVDLLRDKGLPRERFAGMGQVFKKEGLISSPLEERARYLYALSQELGATLTLIDGVIMARVHVVLPERSTTGDPSVPSSAAVFIKHQEGFNLDTVQPQIRRLVTNSIPGLTADKVSIVLVSGQATRPQPQPQPQAQLNPSKVPAASAARGAAEAQPWVILMAALLAASLAGTGFLAWKYWWPQRARGPYAAQQE